MSERRIEAVGMFSVIMAALIILGVLVFGRPM